MAHLVATNKLAELRIISRARQGLLQGRDSGVMEMADREWYWWLESQPTEVDQFYRLEISVAVDEEGQEQPLHTLVAFFSADLRTETESADASQ